MRIIVFGARGDVGSRIVREALERGHDVTAVVRREDQLRSLPKGVTGRVADVEKTDFLTHLMEGKDLAISAVRPPDGEENALVSLTRSVLDAAARIGLRVLLVGGAASLTLSGQNGATVLTAPGFLPDWVVPVAEACQAQFALWEDGSYDKAAYLCPPAMLAPGERTGRYRLGTDVLLADDDGESRISMEDLAVALIDEAETLKHAGTRFTVAY